MLPANLLAATLTKLALNDKPLIAGATSGQQSPPDLEVGQKVQGTVLNQGAPGQFQVRVANQLVQMQLPNSVRPGDTLILQVASLQPRLTFTLLPSSSPVSTPESLSAAARLLSSLSQQPVEKDYVSPIQSTPLWQGETLPDAAQLAGSLHDALSQSGLFYEAHQAQWIAGARPTTQLLLEPQNQPATAAAPASPNSPAANSNAWSALPQDEGAGAGAAAPGAAQSLSANSAAPVIPEHLQPLVQQQMQTLETHQVLWQGQVWPGQEMRWEVNEDATPHQTPGTQKGQWHTQVSLNLPSLGGVSARLSFSGNTLNLSFTTDEARTGDKLNVATPALVAALAQHGIAVTHTRFEPNEHAG